MKAGKRAHPLGDYTLLSCHILTYSRAKQKSSSYSTLLFYLFLPFPGIDFVQSALKFSLFLLLLLDCQSRCGNWGYVGQLNDVNAFIVMIRCSPFLKLILEVFSNEGVFMKNFL